jgi:hypothetical protein
MKLQAANKRGPQTTRYAENRYHDFAAVGWG